MVLPRHDRLASHSLMLIVKVCKAGCNVSFMKWALGVEVWYIGKVVLIGRKCTRTGVHMVPLANNPKNKGPVLLKQEVVNSCSLAYWICEQHTASSTQTHILHNYPKCKHQYLGAQPKSTLIYMICKHPSQFASFQGQTYDLINKHLPLSEAIDKGDLIQTLQNLRPTASSNN